MKRLEYEFHSACYHTDMEVVAGLRTSIGHLIKEVGVCSGGVATWAFNQGSGCYHAAIRLS